MLIMRLDVGLLLLCVMTASLAEMSVWYRAQHIALGVPEHVPYIRWQVRYSAPVLELSVEETSLLLAVNGDIGTASANIGRSATERAERIAVSVYKRLQPQLQNLSQQLPILKLNQLKWDGGDDASSTPFCSARKEAYQLGFKQSGFGGSNDAFNHDPRSPSSSEIRSRRSVEYSVLLIVGVVNWICVFYALHLMAVCQSKRMCCILWVLIRSLFVIICVGYFYLLFHHWHTAGNANFKVREGLMLIIVLAIRLGVIVVLLLLAVCRTIFALFQTCSSPETHTSIKPIVVAIQQAIISSCRGQYVRIKSIRVQPRAYAVVLILLVLTAYSLPGPSSIPMLDGRHIGGLIPDVHPFPATLTTFFSTVLQDWFDLCAHQESRQGHMKTTDAHVHRFASSIKQDLVWPAVWPRRILSFFMGVESCHASEGVEGFSEAHSIAGLLWNLIFKGEWLITLRIWSSSHPSWRKLDVLRKSLEARESEYSGGRDDGISSLDTSSIPAFHHTSLSEMPHIQRRMFLGFQYPSANMESVHTKSDRVQVPRYLRRAFPRISRQFSDYDHATQELLVVQKCPASSLPPVVIIEDMERQEEGYVRRVCTPSQSAAASRRIVHLMDKYVTSGACDVVGSSSSSSPITYTDYLRVPPTTQLPNGIKVSRPCLAITRPVSFDVKTEHDGKSFSHEVGGSILVKVLWRVPKPHQCFGPNYVPTTRILNNANASSTNQELPIPSIPADHFRIPLVSPVTSVVCDTREDFHVHPTHVERDYTSDAQKDNPQSSQGESKPDDVPPSLIMFMVDAFSRQEFRRNWPLVSDYLRYLSQSKESSPPQRHQHNDHPLVPTELVGLTTVGHSTAPNFCTLMGGVSCDLDEGVLKSMGDGGIPTLLKQRFNRSVHTAVIPTDCIRVEEDTQMHRLDVLDAVRDPVLSGIGCPDVVAAAKLHDKRPLIKALRTCTLSGFGGQRGGYDTIMSAIGCHIEEGRDVELFQGGYSMRPRCVSNRHTHDIAFEFVEDLLMMLRADSSSLSLPASVRTSLFYLIYSSASHEGSHVVVGGLDVSVYRFLKSLELIHDYFGPNTISPTDSNPTASVRQQRNQVLLLTDHGSHIGGYYQFSKAGHVERTMPAAVFLGRRPLVSRDSVKGLKEGEDVAGANAADRKARDVLRVSTTSPTTPRDMFVTLCDAAGVQPNAATTAFLQGSKARSLMSPLWIVPEDGTNVSSSRYGAGTCKSAGAHRRCTLRWCSYNQDDVDIVDD